MGGSKIPKFAPMISLTLAFRNIWKNRRRTIATLLAITLGFAAINLFAGYIRNVYRGLKASAVHGEALGHLTIAKRGFFERGSLDPAKYLFSKDDLDRMTALLRAQPGVVLATPRLSGSGLISNGKISTIFIADGEDPADGARLRANPLPPAARLDPARPTAGLVSGTLADMLGCPAGGTVTLLSSTLTGQANALDLDVLDRWDTGTASTNDKTLRLPLSYIRELLDTDGASRVVVLLNESADANRMRSLLAPRLRQAGFDVEIRTWTELSNFYRQVKNLFDLIFLFLFSIVTVVVLMSIVNTLSMSVMERVREIGTIRALGMRRLGVMKLFAVEGAVLGGVGCAAGTLLTLLTQLAVNNGHLLYLPPASSSPVALEIAVSGSSMLMSVAVLCTVAVFAACWPARYAARIEIIDALGHN
jgi:putative ABC transport system permease protein